MYKSSSRDSLIHSCLSSPLRKSVGGQYHLKNLLYYSLTIPQIRPAYYHAFALTSGFLPRHHEFFYSRKPRIDCLISISRDTHTPIPRILRLQNSKSCTRSTSRVFLFAETPHRLLDIHIQGHSYTNPSYTPSSKFESLHQTQTTRFGEHYGGR
jgi:hypothetical protein